MNAERAGHSALIVGGLGALLCLAGTVFAVWNGDGPGAVAALVGLAVPVTGAVVARHVPSNPVGWSQLAGGLFGATGTVGVEYCPLAVRHGWPDVITHALSWFTAWAWLPCLASALVFTALLFPDGRPVRGFRWSLLVGLVAVSLFGVCAGAAFWRYPTRTLVSDDGPSPSGPLITVALLSAAVLVVVAALALVSLVVRWRRADALGRTQVKWVASGLALVAAFVVATESTDLGDWQNTLGTLSVSAVSVSMGVAVLRYRLYDIDRIVSRTVSFGVVLGLLAAVYVGIVVGFGTLVPARFGSVGVALATLVVVAAFLPLTRRVRRVVERRFNRSSVDREQVIVRFAESTRRDVTPEVTASSLLATVEDTVQPLHAGLWMVAR